MHIYWVLVLGDIGRSPRMQYHAHSLSLKRNTSVYLIGYRGSTPKKELLTSANVHIVHLNEANFPASLPRLLRVVLKALVLTFSLIWLMFVKLPCPECILMQTPPAIPSMAIASAAARWYRSKLVVDWHNYGFTILALTYSAKHPIVSLARWYEGFWSKSASSSFCVTKALQADMLKRWNVNPVVLYDRPPEQFRTLDLCSIHDLFSKLQNSLHQPGHHDFLNQAIQELEVQNSHSTNFGIQRTIITVKEAGSVKYSQDRPAVVVSSTSWTPDENFQILLDAALEYEERAVSHDCSLPKALFLVTGKGPEKELYVRKMQSMKLSNVAFRTLWLEAEDYPLLLSSADLGVSLHASSSGLDLPMKVVDMFGCGLPVCALYFDCIKELVSDGQTGLLFKDPTELAQQLVQLFTDWPNGDNLQLQHMREQVVKQHSLWRWEDNWNNVAWPVLSSEAE